MDRMKLMEIFNELLEEWYWAEDVVIHDRGTSVRDEYRELEKRKQAYKEKFVEALKN